MIAAIVASDAVQVWMLVEKLQPESLGFLGVSPLPNSHLTGGGGGSAGPSSSQDRTRPGQPTGGVAPGPDRGPGPEPDQGPGPDLGPGPGVR